jgi:D-alanyl-D-alanine carboxypeptidase
MKKIFTFLILLFSILNAGATGAHALYSFEETSYIIKDNIQEIRPIASITKLITAVTVINSGVDLEQTVKVNGKSRGHVPSNTLMSRHDLMRAMLISSDNRAAETLANNHPGGFAKFILDANAYLEEHSLFSTKIVDSSGLLAGNVSNAQDLIELLSLLKDNKIIKNIAGERFAKINMPKGKKNVTINLHNTNPEIFTFDNILMSKTGYTNPAGRCVLMLVEKSNKLFGVVVLGQKNTTSRSKLVKELLSVNFETRPAPLFKTVITDFDYENVTE